MAESNHDDGWRLELLPTLRELANHLRKRPPSDRPVAVPIGAESISVTPAERKVLLRTAERGGSGLGRHFILVSDALVLRAKLVKDLQGLAAAAEEGRARAAATVRHDVSMGLDLLRAMQGEMAVLMSTGMVEHGRRLAEHRGFVSDALQRAQRQLEGGGFEVAAPASTGSGTVGDVEKPPGDRSRGGERPGRVWAPRVVAGLLLALLALLLLQLWSGRARDLPEVTAADFAFIPGVQTVACRPPSVIVVVPGNRWVKLTREARLQAVESAALVVDHLGYTKLQIRSSAGGILGEWRDGEGASVGK